MCLCRQSVSRTGLPTADQACALLQINSQKKKTGIIAPRRFVQRLKRDNELFRSYMHQVCCP